MSASAEATGIAHDGPVGDPEPARPEPAAGEGDLFELLSEGAQPRQETAWFVPGRIEVLGKAEDAARLRPGMSVQVTIDTREAE